MATRFFCFWAAAVLAGLAAPSSLFLTAPFAWADGGASMAASTGPGAPPSPAPVSTGTLASGRTPKKAARKKRRPLSPFVQIAQRTIGEAPLCDEEAVISGATISSGAIACLAHEPGLYWVFARPFSSAPGRWEDIGADIPNHGLQLQPLTIAFVPFSPRLTLDFASVAGEDWLLAPLEVIGNEASQTATNLQETPLDRNDPPFAYHLGLNRQSALIAGLGWIDDVSDTTGMAPAFARAGAHRLTGAVGAVNLTLGASIDDFTLTGGYLHAVDRKNDLDNVDAVGENDPTAWNSMLAYRTRFLDRKTTLAVGYQKSSDSLSRYFPDERYTTRASILLFDATTLSLEYYQDRQEATDSDLDGSDAYGITTKFGFDF